VVTVSGSIYESATVVLRDGVIEAVGPNVTAPPDARPIEGKGLTLTPGLIDGFGGLGLPKPPKGKGTANESQPASDPLTPQAFSLDRIQAKEALKARSSGVTTALVISGDGVLPGRSVLINLSADTVQGMALAQPAALHLHMAPREDKYPDSLMGIVALARQSLWSATRYRDEWAAYQRAPRGKRRPRYDAGLAAWQDVISGKLPLVVTAMRENDIRRAAAVVDELKVKVIVAGAPRAARVADLIKARKIPIIVGVNFDPPRPARFTSLEDDERERQEIDEAERTPAALHRAGVSFGFGSGHAQDYLAGMRKAVTRGLPREVALRAATLGAAEALGVGDRLGSLEVGKIANVVGWSGEPLAEEAKVKLVIVDGQLFEPEPDADKEKETAAKAAEKRAEATPVAPYTPPVPPEALRGTLAIVGGTLLTASSQKTIANGTVLIENGRITAVGRDLAPPPGARVIDARGRYVMPGIIDAHSHTGIEGNVNECTDAVTAEVRIADVLDPNHPDIYRQLAGGVTTLNVLHGSCNAIGGQNAVIKMRYGKSPQELLFVGAPGGIKFALGENPKRSNFRTESARYPATRMGVEALIRASFEEARAYKREWEEYARKLKLAAPGDKPVAPRKDLRLEALKDVLEGKLLVHSHCYRSDEILMLMRLAEDFGFKVRTFQHVLEGYKVASEIARHGAGASTFIDWWAFKLESYDGTPYNPAIMAAHGVRVSLNSDSEDLARRLHWDAAKAMKYGGVSEDEALRMITLNPAWQLGIDQRVGSLEVGKDADIAIFGAHPFSPDARVEMTLVDGAVYFDRSKAPLAAGGAR
jgi:imidazolonepropionase-like amidohydrolase